MIRVLVVDDSALMRDVLTAILSSDPQIEVVGAACDPFIARDMIKDLNPDVLTLDIEMPRMDGLTFLKNLMRLRPMPVVMVSTLTERGCSVTLDALGIGAVDYVAKPKTDQRRQLNALSDDLIAKVKAASTAKRHRRRVGEARCWWCEPRGGCVCVDGPRRRDRCIDGRYRGDSRGVVGVADAVPADRHRAAHSQCV